MDAFHDGEDVRFRRMDHVVGEAEVLGLVTRLLNDPELSLMSAEEPATFMLAEPDPNLRRAMVEEMRSIEDNWTWELVEPPPPIGLNGSTRLRASDGSTRSSVSSWGPW